MSATAEDWAWRQDVANSSERLVLLCLAHFANRDGENAYPTHATICECTKLGNSTVRRDIGRLVKRRLMEKAPAFRPNGQQTSCRYRLMLREGGATTWHDGVPPGSELPPDSTPGCHFVAEGAPPHGTQDSKDSNQEGKNTEPVGNTETPKEPELPLGGTCDSFAPSSQNENDKAPGQSVGRSRLRRKTGSQPEHPRFADFWAAYPRHEAKLKAAEAFAKAVDRGVDPDAIIAGIARSPALRRERQFQPYPASWLNAGGWMDDPEPAPPRVKVQPNERGAWLAREMFGDRFDGTTIDGRVT